jgi:7-cyano-7-deazaguanine synthase in queuosine biosynthesis
MKVICAPAIKMLGKSKTNTVRVLLFGRTDKKEFGSAGASIAEELKRSGLRPSDRALDLLSLALSVIATDLGAEREKSPDGWTREIELAVAVRETSFWESQRQRIESMLRFLTTDRWFVRFTEDGFTFEPGQNKEVPSEKSIALLSGGLDSLIGAIDLAQRGEKPFAVSQIARGDGEKQTAFAKGIGGGLRHLQLNHNAETPGENERSQRARSLIFLTYGVLAATTLKRYMDGEVITLYVCENGFISVNPPLTDARLGSLSTRTAHPAFLPQFQGLLDAAGLRVRVENPYRFKTKGEMLVECVDQGFLRNHAHIATSCGRFLHYGHKHCGRCVPCLIRRAAFLHWKVADKTEYVYPQLNLADSDHAGFDDVRSMAMALATVEADGIDRWIGASLASGLIDNPAECRATVQRGLDEAGRFFAAMRIK